MTDDWLVRQVTELKARVKQLEAQRTGYVQAPVTAVDTGSSTFTVQPPAQQDGAAVELSGLAAPPHFLPDVGDEVTLALTGARPRYTPARIAADAVGYTELDSTVGGDITTAKADATTALTAANGKNTVTYSPDAPDYTANPGDAVGDLWFQIDADDIVRGSWQWDGTGWATRTFGDQVLATLTAGKITSGEIAAGTVVTVGPQSSTHSELTDSAISFYAPVADGTLVEMAQLGQRNGGVDPATGLQTWAIDEKGAASFQDLSTTNDPIFQGVALSQQLDGKGEFTAGASRGDLTDPVATPTSGGELGFYEFTVELEAGHLYELQSSNIWVRPSATSPATRLDLNLRYTVSTDPNVDPPAVSLTSPYFARWAQAVSGSLGHGVVLSRLLRYDTYAQFRFLVSLASFGGGGYIEMGSENHADAALGVTIQPDAVVFWLSDLGLHPWTNRAVVNTGGGGTAPAPVKRYSYDYFSHWSRWFRGDGSVAGDNGDCYQGQTPYYPANGDEATQIGGFSRANGGPTLYDDLQGATLESLQVYLYANHWNYYDGGTAVIRYHNNATAGALNNYAGGITVPGWARNQGRWVDITSWGSLFQNGPGARGIQVGKANSTDPTYYGIFDGPGSANAPRIRATFTK